MSNNESIVIVVLGGWI